MTPTKKNGGYRAGQIDQILVQLTESQIRIEGKLDENLEWQRGVDTRLAAGSVQIGQLQEQGRDHDLKIGALVLSDRRWGGAAVFVSAIFAGIGSIVGVTFGIRR